MTKYHFAGGFRSLYKEHSCERVFGSLSHRGLNAPGSPAFHIALGVLVCDVACISTAINLCLPCSRCLSILKQRNPTIAAKSFHRQPRLREIGECPKGAWAMDL